MLDTSASFLLGRFAQWVGAHAPAGRGRVGLWHMLTDAFPPPGVAWEARTAGRGPNRKHLEPAAWGACESMCVRAVAARV